VNVLSEKIARGVVKDCLCICADDTVLINTWQHTVDLANLIALECHKVGAKTLTNLDTDDVFYGSMRYEPLESLKKQNKALIGLWDHITASIYLDGPEDPVRMRKIPAERWAAMAEGDKPFMDLALKKRKRSIYITLGLVTPQRAKTYGFKYPLWKRAVTEATTVNYASLTRFGKKVKAALEKAKKVQITGKGVKLGFQLEDRPVFVFDGVVDEEDMKMGAFDATLPAGSVSVAPAEKSAEGTVQFDLPIATVGKLVHGLKWSFKNGKLTEYEAKKNVEAARAWWEKAHGDKDKIGSLTLGINPKARFGFLNNSIVQGAVTIGIGDNRFLGGKNNSDYGFEGTLSKATVKLDKKTIIKTGKYVI